MHDARRIANLKKKEVIKKDWTPFFKKKRGELFLRDVQNEALTEAVRGRGLIGLIGCGHGKTLITLLLSGLLGLKRPLLLLPASLKRKTREDIKFYGEHFEFSPPEIMSYEKLSR